MQIIKKIFTLSLVIAAILSAAITANGQVSLQWVQRQPSPNHSSDDVCGVGTDQAGNVYIAGRTWTEASYEDIIVIKYSPTGQRLWHNRYSGLGRSQDHPYDMTVDSDGNLYVVGSTQSVSNGLDLLLLKYTTQGVLQWCSTFNSTYNGTDIGKAITLGSDGYIYVTGYSDGQGSVYNLEDFLTLKYNSGGQLIWSARYNSPSNCNDEGVAIAVDQARNVFVTGLSDTPSGLLSSYDFATIKYNSQGIQQWVARYPGLGGIDTPIALALDAVSNVVVTGTSQEGADWSLPYDLVTIKYNSSGARQWVMRYDLPATGSSEWASDVGIDQSGNIIVCGWSSSYSGLTIKYDPQGVQQWAQNETRSWPQMNRLSIDAAGDVYVVGKNYWESGDYDLCLFKYDPLGNRLWVTRYDTGNLEEGQYITLDQDNNIVISGTFSYSDQADYDFLTLKYSQTGQLVMSGEGQIEKGVVPEADSSTCIPNPFNPSTTIQFTLSEPARVNLEVYNISGRIVGWNNLESLPSGTHELMFDGSGLPSGVYIYRLSLSRSGTTRTTMSGKMMLLK